MSTVLLDDNFIVWCWGRNSFGQLGSSGCCSVGGVPKKTMVNIISLGCSQEHTLVVDDEGNVFAYGCNDYGQLGLGHYNTTYSPMKIKNIPRIKFVTCGNKHTILIDENGETWSCGSNSHFQLGNSNSNFKRRNTFKKIIGLPKIKYASCGNDNTILIDENGCVWSFGHNVSGSLGVGYYDIHITNPKKIPNIPLMKHASCGSTYTILVDEHGNVWTAGAVAWKLGRTSSFKNIFFSIKTVQTISLMNSTMLIDEKGNVWSLGDNDYGQLGLGHNKSVHIPEKIDALPPISKIFFGRNNTFFLDHCGNFWACGLNDIGQLGLGDYENRSTPVILEFLGESSSIKSARNVGCKNVK